MSTLPDFIPPSVAKAAKPAKAAPNFSNSSDFSSLPPAENDDLPLAAKLRALGQPIALTIDDTVFCWLVADDEAARRADVTGVTYTAAEAEVLAAFDAEGIHELHALKAALGGTIGPDIDE